MLGNIFVCLPSDEVHGSIGVPITKKQIRVKPVSPLSYQHTEGCTVVLKMQSNNRLAYSKFPSLIENFTKEQIIGGTLKCHKFVCL